MELNVLNSDNPKPEKKLTDIQKVVLMWKLLHGIDKDNKGWDKVYFARFSRTAKNILLVFNGDLGAVADFLDWFVEYFQAKNLDYTFETTMNHVHTYQRRAR